MTHNQNGADATAADTVRTRAEPGARWSTEEFARANHVKGDSVRTRLCRTGSYFGIKPNRLRNGRLSWPPVTA